jgi:hypothetical protein
MERPDVDLSELGPSWWSPSESEAAKLLSELHTEMPSGHALEGALAEPVAIKKLLKDLILWLPDRDEWARVHLTYSPESDPRYPWTSIATTWEALLTDLRRGRSRASAELHEQIEELLFRADPIGINFEDNTDEYDPETRTIVDRLPSARSEEDAVRIVHEEFVRWFDEKIAGGAERYRVIGADIWRLWLSRQIE